MNNFKCQETSSKCRVRSKGQMPRAMYLVASHKFSGSYTIAKVATFGCTVDDHIFSNILNLMQSIRKNLFIKKLSGSYALSIMLCALIFTSCNNMIFEDLPECAPPPRTYTVVNFVYDYNMSGANTGNYEDWFDDHAGSVYLYIFDKYGKYLDRREKHKEFFERGEDFTMTFTDEELIPGETYDFVAVAQGNTMGLTASDDYNWFRLVYPMIPGESTIKDYILRLDRDTNNDGFAEVGVVNYKDQYGNTQQMIDTLWTTKPDEVQTVTIRKEVYVPSIEQQPDVVTEVTVPMMRITNSIRVNVVNPSFREDTDVDSYHVVIYFPKGNGTVDFTGDISQSPMPLYYQSLVKKMVPYQERIYSRSSNEEEYFTRAGEDQYTLQALFGVSRLQTSDGSQLQLYSADNPDEPIYVIEDFSKTLAEYLNDPSWEMGNQEFLDREYNFDVEITLTGGDPLVALTIDILPWWVRVNDIDL